MLPLKCSSLTGTVPRHLHPTTPPPPLRPPPSSSSPPSDSHPVISGADRERDWKLLGRGRGNASSVNGQHVTSKSVVFLRGDRPNQLTHWGNSPPLPLLYLPTPATVIVAVDHKPPQHHRHNHLASSTKSDVPTAMRGDRARACDPARSSGKEVVGVKRNRSIGEGG